ncbi:MAG: right-handed parallel beta-helix repeat-containing protein [Victivallaceae bacterium]|nr:right-handed parallel beta-helix repeat-containing protein [Victivallaceae bacterium]
MSNRLFLAFLATVSLGIAGCDRTRTIECAADRADFDRALEESRKLDGNREIVIGNGVMRIAKPIELDGRDSGLVLRGSGNTVVSGGIPLEFSPVPGKPYWSAKIPAGLPDPQLVSRKDANIPVAVYPHDGMAKYLETTDLIWLGSQYGGWNRPPREYEMDRITIPPAELPDFDPADAEIYVPHSWDSSLVRVASVNRASGLVVFANFLRRPAGGYGSSRYRIRNIEAGLVPGSWMYHRATREVFYHPLPGEKPESVARTAAACERLRTVSGAGNVRVEKIEFSDCNGPAKVDRKLPLNDPGVVSSTVCAAGCEDLVLSEITVRNVHGNAVKVAETPASRSVRIENSRFTACGVNGLLVHADGDSAVEGCEVSDCGYNGITAYTHRGSRFRISGNRVSRTGYCGIGMRQTPDRSGEPSDVVIERNEISGAMSDGSMQDGAGIYVFGAENWRIDDNRISGMPDRGLRHGIYFDETSFRSTATGNRVSTFFPVMVHKASGIEFRNCRFDHSGPMKFDLVDSDGVTLRNCDISAPEILFSAPEGGLRRENCRTTGKVTENVKKHNFTFSLDGAGVLRCTKVPAKKNERKLPRRIVCFGDSITAAGTFAGELQLYLSCRYPRERIEVFNAGVGGDSAVDGFRRLERDVLSRNPDMVVVCFGMNDVGHAYYGTRFPADAREAEAREKGFESYRENMKKIVDALSGRGIEVVVMAPFPYDEYGTRPEPDAKSDYCNSVGLERLAAHCYNTYAAKFLFPMSRTMLCRLYAWFPELQVAKDRVHPNRFGHWVVANEIAKTVFRDIPARDPIPFPATREMEEFSKIGEGRKFPLGIPFAPLDTLLENGGVDGPTAALRERLEEKLACDGKLKQLAYYDGILRQKGIDPADTAKADPVLADFARRWHLTKDVEKYFKGRAEREKLTAEAQSARDRYFKLVEELASHPLAK